MKGTILLHYWEEERRGEERRGEEKWLPIFAFALFSFLGREGMRASNKRDTTGSGRGGGRRSRRRRRSTSHTKKKNMVVKESKRQVGYVVQYVPRMETRVFFQQRRCLSLSLPTYLTIYLYSVLFFMRKDVSRIDRGLFVQEGGGLTKTKRKKRRLRQRRRCKGGMAGSTVKDI